MFEISRTFKNVIFFTEIYWDQNPEICELNSCIKYIVYNCRTDDEMSSLAMWFKDM